MTRKQILSMVRKLIADEHGTGFTEGGNLEEPEASTELENYLDRAVDEYSKRQAMSGDVRLMREAEMKDGDTLPSDYLSFCGIMPVKVIGNKIKFYVSGKELLIRYMARLPYVTAYKEEAELPYESDQSIAISALAAIYALNKHEANISQHLLLMGYGTNGTAQPEE